MSESKESGSVRGIRNAYIFTAIAISCLMVGASLGVTLSASAPNIPTVIEPGTLVSGDYYLVFAGDDGLFVKNGTTGAIEASGSDASTLVNYAIQQTPPGQTVRVLGNLNFTSPIQINKDISLVIPGNETAWHTDFLIIGDETHFVTGGTVMLGSVNGVDQWTNTSAIRFRQSISVNVFFSDLMLFQYGIYFDPVGIGSGENSLFGGRVIACDYGISWNMSSEVTYGIWSQGNRFYASVYMCDVYGFYASGRSACDMQLFYGTIDCAPGMLGSLNLPGWHGGGRDIQDEKGAQKFFLVYVGLTPSGLLNYLIGPGTVLMTQQGELLPGLVYTFSRTVSVGINSTLGPAAVLYPIVSVPRQMTITLEGSFGTSEQITVRVRAQLAPVAGDLTYGPSLWLNFTDTGSTNLTVPQLYGLVPSGCAMFQVFVYACSNQSSTNVTASVTAYV